MAVFLNTSRQSENEGFLLTVYLTAKTRKHFDEHLSLTQINCIQPVIQPPKRQLLSLIFQVQDFFDFKDST